MLTPEVQALYDEGRVKTRQMLRFQFGSGLYGFISDRSPLTHQGLEYVPFGLIKVSDIENGSGTSANGGFTLTLAESPDDGLTPEILMQIEDEDYRDRPVTVYDAHFHPDTGALLQVEAVARGYLDTIDHDEQPDTGKVLIARCEGRQLDYSRKNGRKRSMTDQQRRKLGDKYFEHSGKSGRVEVVWGRNAAAK